MHKEQRNTEKLKTIHESLAQPSDNGINMPLIVSHEVSLRIRKQ